jgi:acetyltransferase-like isoleucine patch superfamily enzyme
VVCGFDWLAAAVSIAEPDGVNLLCSVDLLLLAKPLAALGKLRLRALGVALGQRVVLYGLPVVSLSPGSEIRIGSHVVLCSWSRYTALGVNHATVLRTLAPEARLTIGDHVGISGGAICAAASVTIGAYTMLGANVTVADTDFHPLAALNRRYSQTGIETSPVVIGSNVFLGTGAVVLKGVHIGDNSVIGAGSVVARDIPPDVIAAGNPCRVVRALEGKEHLVAK